MRIKVAEAPAFATTHNDCVYVFCHPLLVLLQCDGALGSAEMPAGDHERPMTAEDTAETVPEEKEAKDSNNDDARSAPPTTTATASPRYVLDEVDVELYGEAILNPPTTCRDLTTYSFQVSDFLPCVV